MTLDQLIGRYLRLTRELSLATAQRWQQTRIARITIDLAETEREIAVRQAAPFSRVRGRP